MSSFNTIDKDSLDGKNYARCRDVLREMLRYSQQSIALWDNSISRLNQASSCILFLVTIRNSLVTSFSIEKFLYHGIHGDTRARIRGTCGAHYRSRYEMHFAFHFRRKILAKRRSTVPRCPWHGRRRHTMHTKKARISRVHRAQRVVRLYAQQCTGCLWNPYIIFSLNFGVQSTKVATSSVRAVRWEHEISITINFDSPNDRSAMIVDHWSKNEPATTDTRYYYFVVPFSILSSRLLQSSSDSNNVLFLWKEEGRRKWTRRETSLPRWTVKEISILISLY